MSFSGYTTTPPAGSPKKELFASAYIQNGGPIDPSTWVYYTSFTGTLTGTGNYAGAVIQLDKTGPAFQIGKGANGKNGNFGGSGWFNWTVTSQPTSGGSLQTTGQGDINVDLANCQNIGSVGDRVWNDANGNGVQDAGEDGINGVTVQLVDSGGNLIASAVTSGDGNYSFSLSRRQLLGERRRRPPCRPASPRATTSTVSARRTPPASRSRPAPAGPTSTSATAARPRSATGCGTTPTATVSRTRVRPASTASPSSSSTPPTTSSPPPRRAATATTPSRNLNAGTYTVKVVASSLPAGLTPTYDLDGVATPNTATLSLAAGANRTDVDFGYKHTGSVGDRVWLDTNGNGVAGRGRGRHQRRHRPAPQRRQHRRGDHHDQRRRQLHLQQPRRRQLHGEDRRLLAPRGDRADLRPRRHRNGQPGRLHPRRRRQPHRRRLRLQVHRLHR